MLRQLSIQKHATFCLCCCEHVYSRHYLQALHCCMRIPSTVCKWSVCQHRLMTAWQKFPQPTCCVSVDERETVLPTLVIKATGNEKQHAGVDTLSNATGSMILEHIVQGLCAKTGRRACRERACFHLHVASRRK